MQYLAFGLASMLALATTGLAQNDVQSHPFQLVVHSHHHKHNGTALGACHEGAGIEGLCLGGGSTFHFNTSKNEEATNEFAGKTGVLTYSLVGGNFAESQPMRLVYNDASNVAVPLFEPSADYTAVAFDKHNRMNIQSYYDDTVVPVATGTKAYYRWYVCETDAGEEYTTLAWVMGEFPPQNPSCRRVQVIREFV